MSALVKLLVVVRIIQHVEVFVVVFVVGILMQGNKRKFHVVVILFVVARLVTVLVINRVLVLLILIHVNVILYKFVHIFVVVTAVIRAFVCPIIVIVVLIIVIMIQQNVFSIVLFMVI